MVAHVFNRARKALSRLFSSGSATGGPAPGNPVPTYNPPALLSQELDVLLSDRKYVRRICREVRRTLGPVVASIDPSLHNALTLDERHSLLSKSLQQAERLMLNFHALEHLCSLDDEAHAPVNQTVELNGIFDSIYNRFLAKARELRLNLVVSLDGHVPMRITADAGRIRTIVEVLVDNALTYTERGEVTVRFEFESETKSLIITVRDTGIGMDAGIVAAILRLRNPTVTGSLLTDDYFPTSAVLVQLLVRDMGGTLDLESTLGVGTIYTVKLPVLIPADTPNLSRETAPKPLEIKRLWQKPEFAALTGTALLVTANDLTYSILNHHLSNTNLTLVRDRQGEEAVARVQARGKFDLILLDLELPKLDGMKTATAIQNLGNVAPLIALLPGANLGELAHAARSGFDGFLSVPFRSEHLLKVLLVYLNARLPNASPRTRYLAAITSMQGDLNAMRSCLYETAPELIYLIDEFLVEFQRLLADLEVAIADGDLPKARQCGHDIKGLGGMLGYPDLSDEAKTLMEAVDESQPLNIVRSLKRMRLMNRAMLRAHLSDPDQEAPDTQPSSPPVD